MGEERETLSLLFNLKSVYPAVFTFPEVNVKLSAKNVNSLNRLEKSNLPKSESNLSNKQHSNYYFKNYLTLNNALDRAASTWNLIIKKPKR